MAKDARPAPTDIVSDPIGDPTALPPGVAAMRRRILDACGKGDIEALRIPIEWNEVKPLFERGARRPPGEDPIERLKALSADGRGYETLATLRATLRQSFVTVRTGPTLLYVWPAFARKPLADPSAEERAVMLTCVRFDDLKSLDGAPAPMELAIGADGVWHWFWTSRGPRGRG